jgi:hypothetical protein
MDKPAIEIILEYRAELERLQRDIAQDKEAIAVLSAGRPIGDIIGLHTAQNAIAEAERLQRENAELRVDAELWLNLLRGYRKAVGDVATYFDKPVTDENVVFWLNLNNAGAAVDAAIDSARKEPK